MIKTLLLTAATFAVLLIAQADNAHAQYLGNNNCYGGMGGIGLGVVGSPYALGRIPTPPYFAIHPPVYYSQPVPRTYGYSPFAYPGSVRTPDVQPTKPAAKMMKNPYTTPAKAKVNKSIDLKSVTKRVEPLEILNPFVNQSNTRMVSVEK